MQLITQFESNALKAYKVGKIADGLTDNATPNAASKVMVETPSGGIETVQISALVAGGLIPLEATTLEVTTGTSTDKYVSPSALNLSSPTLTNLDVQGTMAVGGVNTPLASHTSIINRNFTVTDLPARQLAVAGKITIDGTTAVSTDFALISPNFEIDTGVNHGYLAGLHLDAHPVSFLSGSTASITANLYISGAVTGGTKEYSIYVAGGDTSLGGDLIVAGRSAFGESAISPFAITNFGGTLVNATPADRLGVLINVDLEQTTNNADLIGMHFAPVIEFSSGNLHGEASSLRIVSPDITLTSSSTLTTASTLHIVDAPTEGVNNYALWVEAGDVHFNEGLVVQDRIAVGNAVGVPSPDDTFLLGEFAGTGHSQYRALRVSGDFTIDSGVLDINAVEFNTAIAMQNTGNTNAYVSNVFMKANITNSLGPGTITNASTLRIDASPSIGTNNYAILVNAGDVSFGGGLTVADMLEVSGIGINPVPFAKVVVGGDFSFNADSEASGLLTGIQIEQVTGTKGSIGFKNTTGLEFTTNALHDYAYGASFDAPDITLNGTSTVTVGATVNITGAPTEGINNYALRVGSGLSYFGGDLTVKGTLLVGNGLLQANELVGLRRIDTTGNIETHLYIGGAFSNYTSGNDISVSKFDPALSLTSGTYTNISTAHFTEPSITPGSATITNASTVYIEDAPTEGVNNYALRVGSGLSSFGGDADIGGALTVGGDLEVDGYVGSNMVPEKAFDSQGVTVPDTEHRATIINSSNNNGGFFTGRRAEGVLGSEESVIDGRILAGLRGYAYNSVQTITFVINTGAFLVGELVTQTTSGATGTVVTTDGTTTMTLEPVSGTFVTGADPMTSASATTTSTTTVGDPSEIGYNLCGNIHCVAVGTHTDISQGTKWNFQVVPVGGVTPTNKMTLHGDRLEVVDDLTVGGDLSVVGKTIVNQTELTLDNNTAGAVVVTGTYHNIDTNADASTGELSNATGGVTGQRLIIVASNSGRDIVVKHNATGSGQFYLNGLADITINSRSIALEFIYNNDRWCQLGGL